ncbi:MAG: primosomal protein N', partial [Lachnospiraceae bacterium]
PRSAIFTPFTNLGLIIIDEEHEGTYKSENVPKYHAREVAVYRAMENQGKVVLGSATPSVDSYYRAKKGEYALYEMTERAKAAKLPKVYVEDLREELKRGNKTMFSDRLNELIKDRLKRREQIMLFINRRGYAGFVSCRSCGYVMKCPHCDVGLTLHNNDTLVCHYCNYTVSTPKVCPECGSKYIAAFGTGTQKVEEAVKKMYPEARVLRMDMDTTMAKDGHEKILSSFADGEADILVGTQMIVKGHDFSNVTLVGVIAADMSLYASDYRAAERTFQLLTQAAGRAGRGEREGEVVIQTYNPDNFAIEAAAKQDYKEFYEREILYRKLMEYPPCYSMTALLITSKDEKLLQKGSNMIKASTEEYLGANRERTDDIRLIGPAKANISRINDVYRMVYYIKSEEYGKLVEIKNHLEKVFKDNELFKNITLQFDFNPMGGI